MTSTTVVFRGSRGDLYIVAAPEGAQPFPVDAVAEEEDTFLVLSARAALTYPGEHPLRVIHAAFNARPEPPGRVVVKDGEPLRLLAVVHDLSLELTWRQEWVATAFDGVLRECEQRQLSALALPLLGTVHGDLPVPSAVALLTSAFDHAPLRSLRRLWLVVADGVDPEHLLPLALPPTSPKILPYRR